MSDRGTGGSRDGERPWYESLPDGRSWAALWSGYVRCACGAIWSMEAECPVCGKAPPKEEWVVMRDADGTEYRVPPVFNGAEGRYEDWTWLRMLEREWLRPADADLYDSTPEDSRPSARAIVVLGFWSYFETRIERLFRETAKATNPSSRKSRGRKGFFASTLAATNTSTGSTAGFCTLPILRLRTFDNYPKSGSVSGGCVSTAHPADDRVRSPWPHTRREWVWTKDYPSPSLSFRTRARNGGNTYQSDG